MAPKSKGSRLRIGEPHQTEIAALRAVLGGGSTEIGVLRDAVRALVDLKCKNKQFKTQYEAELRRLKAERVQPLRLVRDKDATP